MLFMSVEHIAAMNDLLAGSPAVKAAAANLDRDYSMEYQLTDSPTGSMAYWVMRFGPDGVEFSLTPSASPDVVFRGTWRAAIAEARAAREGGEADAGIEMSGDPAVLEIIAPVFAAAQQVATMQVSWPEI
jgi:hypothetical protein